MKRFIVPAIALATLMIACEPDERETICANCVTFCPNQVCESLPLLPCDLVDQLDDQWPCPCVGPGLIGVDQPVPDGPGIAVGEG